MTFPLQPFSSLAERDHKPMSKAGLKAVQSLRLEEVLEHRKQRAKRSSGRTSLERWVKEVRKLWRFSKFVDIGSRGDKMVAI